MRHQIIATTAAFVLGVISACAADVPSVQPKQIISLDGVEGRIDHLAFDDANDRLYVAALGNNTVEVIDVKAGKRIGQLKGVKEPQGLCMLPDSILVVASGGDGKVSFYDKEQKLVATVDGLDDADNVRYDAAAKLVYVGYGSGALAVIDPAKHAKIADIQLKGHPESFQIEASANRIFVNVPTLKQVAVIDREQRKVVTTWPVTEAASNFPMALDEVNHRLILGCRKPAKLLVLDTQTGKTTTSLDCPDDTDDVFYDAENKKIYVSGGNGTVNVISQSDADHYSLLSKFATGSGARTSLLVSRRKSLFVAAPHRGKQQAHIRVYSAATENGLP